MDPHDYNQQSFFSLSLGSPVTITKLLLVLAMSLSAAMPAAGTSPDILLIAVDDLNDWVGPLGGHPQAKTPHIDRLARRGMTFANAHVTAPLCNPSRASLMSGMLTSSFGVYLNRQDWREAPALEGQPVLPLFLQRNGYRTLGGGKLFHAATVNPLQFYGLLPRRRFRRLLSGSEPAASGRDSTAGAPRQQESRVH